MFTATPRAVLLPEGLFSAACLSSALQAGPDVRAVTLPMDGVRNKGFAFIEFETPESAAYAVSLFKGNLRLFDRQLRVDFGGKGGGGAAQGSTGRPGGAVARVPSFSGGGIGSEQPTQQHERAGAATHGGTPPLAERAAPWGDAGQPQQPQQVYQQQAHPQLSNMHQSSEAAPQGQQQQMLPQQSYAGPTMQQQQQHQGLLLHQQQALMGQQQLTAAYGQVVAGHGMGIAGQSLLGQQQQHHSPGFAAHPLGPYF